MPSKPARRAYTMASFLSRANTRGDGYGGSRENRLRLPLEVYREVRARVGGDWTVGCRFLVYQNRVEYETHTFIGRRTDVLRRADESWQIARRELILEQNVLLAKNLSILF